MTQKVIFKDRDVIQKEFKGFSFEDQVCLPTLQDMNADTNEAEINVIDTVSFKMINQHLYPVQPKIPALDQFQYLEKDLVSGPNFILVI